jgi:peptidoglycan/LPS O-acetylase OafA/YrhL
MNATAIADPIPVEKQVLSKSQRVPQLDGLRGVAVLMVVLYHYELSLRLPDRPFFVLLGGCFHLGVYGVDLFFVLSGLLIGGILLDYKSSPRYFHTFYWRRFLRIFPLYYLWLGLYLILAMTVFPTLPAGIRCPWEGWRPLWVYAGFLQNVVSKRLNGISAAWLGPLWSLAVEEQFYLLMPLAVYVLSKRRLTQLLVAVVLGAPMLRLVFSWWRPGAQFNATALRADALAMGVLLALAFRHDGCKRWIESNPRWLYGFIGLLCVGVFLVAGPIFNPAAHPSPVWSLSCMGLFFSSVIALALLRPHGWWSGFCKASLLRSVGGLSYCIYVVHLAVNTLCQTTLQSNFYVRPLVSDGGGAAIAAAITYALARLSWRYVESPMLRRGQACKY